MGRQSWSPLGGPRTSGWLQDGSEGLIPASEPAIKKTHTANAHVSFWRPLLAKYWLTAQKKQIWLFYSASPSNLGCCVFFIDLVGDGAHLHGHISFLWHLFSKWMVRQSEAVSDARCVEQKGIENVLIHLCAFVIWQWIRQRFDLSFSLWTTKEST